MRKVYQEYQIIEDEPVNVNNDKYNECKALFLSFVALFLFIPFMTFKSPDIIIKQLNETNNIIGTYINLNVDAIIHKDFWIFTGICSLVGVGGFFLFSLLCGLMMDPNCAL